MALDLEISLAQWSLHQAFFSKELEVTDFPMIAKNRYGITAVEYVTQFFSDKINDSAYFSLLNQNAKDAGVKNVLLMIDDAGALATPDPTARARAIGQHHQWMEAAVMMGCTSVRVNLHGHDRIPEWRDAALQSLSRLAEVGRKMNLNVLVENHGGLSSNAALLVDVIRTVNMPNIGTMPDFGNFCIRREVDGDLWHSPCIESYDIYKGVSEMLPLAGAVSAKSFTFDEAGYEAAIDYFHMLRLIKAAGYRGYIGIEYAGYALSEDEGIKKTKALILKALASAELNSLN